MAELQRRRKWKKTRENIKKDDLVLIRVKNCKRNEWPVGRVNEVKYSKDGLVRSAEVVVKRTSPDAEVKTFTYLRPIGELVLLNSS